MSPNGPHAGDPNACQVVVGALVPRPCGAARAGTCPRCGRAFCAEHTGAGGSCTHCDRQEEPPAVALELPADLAFTADDLDRFAIEQPGDPADAWSDLT